MLMAAKDEAREKTIDIERQREDVVVVIVVPETAYIYRGDRKSLVAGILRVYPHFYFILIMFSHHFLLNFSFLLSGYGVVRYLTSTIDVLCT